jgi:hypothetical protein
MGVLAIVLITAFAVFPATARAAGYVGGGGHAGFAYRGGYGFRGGWRGYGGWGWGWGGLGYGLFFGALPFYYSTLWWGGVPYYYAAGVYYRWNGVVGEYETVPAPPGLESQVDAQQPSATNLFVYPKSGQSAEQQANDRYECHRWARDQTGFDPTQPSAGSAAKRQDYVRAQTACLEGRGYSVK